MSTSPRRARAGLVRRAAHSMEASVLRRRSLLLVFCAALAGSSACVSNYSTDIPVNYQSVLTEKYVGRRAWTRATLQDEKKNIKIEQDQEVTILTLGMHRTGSLTVISKVGHKRVVFPMHLKRPLTLEIYEKTMLDYLWLESPEARFEANKQKYGTRIAEAVRDHKILKDMPQYVAYLAWGAPTSNERPEGTAVDRWKYDTPNLAGARIDFLAGKVAKFEGENVGDTEAAKKKKSMRRGGNEPAEKK
jgi:hypothetical protein